MSAPNPILRRHRASRRFSDERIWREFYCACLMMHWPTGHPGTARAAKYADEAYSEYRQRFPVREPELDDDDKATALEPETEGETGSLQPQKEPVQ